MKTKHAVYSTLAILFVFGLLFFGYAVRKPVMRRYRLNRTYSESKETRMTGFRGLLGGDERDLEAATERLIEIENTKLDVDRIVLATEALGGHREPNNAYLAVIHGSMDDKHLWPMFELADWWFPKDQLISGDTPLKGYRGKLLDPWQRASCALMFGKGCFLNLDNPLSFNPICREVFSRNALFLDLKNNAAPYLFTKLTDPDKEVARTATSCITYFRCPGALGRLINVFGETSTPWRTIDCIYRLGGNSEEVVNAFRSFFDLSKDKYPEEVLHAATLVRDDIAADFAIKVLRSESREVQATALQYLWKVPNRKTIPELREMANRDPTEAGSWTFLSALALSKVEPDIAADIFRTAIRNEDEYIYDDAFMYMNSLSFTLGVPLLIALTEELSPEDYENEKWDRIEETFDALSKRYWYREVEIYARHAKAGNSIPIDGGETEEEDDFDMNPEEEARIWGVAERKKLKSAIRDWWAENRNKDENEIRREAVFMAIESVKSACARWNDSPHLVLKYFIPYPCDNDFEKEGITAKEICANMDRFRTYLENEWSSLRFEEGHYCAIFGVRVYHSGKFHWEKLPGEKGK